MSYPGDPEEFARDFFKCFENTSNPKLYIGLYMASIIVGGIIAFGYTVRYNN